MHYYVLPESCPLDNFRLVGEETPERVAKLHKISVYLPKFMYAIALRPRASVVVIAH